MKKYLVPISVATAIALLVVLYLVFFNATNVYDAIPDSAVAVIDIGDWNKLSAELNTSGAATGLMQTAAIEKLSDEVAFMGQIFATSSGLKAVLTGGKITASVHLTTADDFDYLFTLPVKNINNTELLKTFDNRTDIASVIKRTFKNQTVIDITMKDGKRFSFTSLRGILSFSFTSFLTETSITAITGGGNLGHDKDLNKVIKKLGSEGLVNLFINFKKADVIFPAVFRQQKLGLLSDIAGSQNWGGYSVSFNNGRINLIGLCPTVKTDKAQAEPQNILANTIWNSIPDNAAYVNTGFNNRNTGPKEIPVSPYFIGWLGEAHAFITLEPLREDFTDQNIFIAQVKDEHKAITALQHLMDMDGSKAMPIDTFMNMPIYNLKGGAVINQVFGSSFTTFGNSYFCVGNHMAVFCNSADILKFTLEKIKKGETLNKDAKMLKSIGQLKKGTGVLYINPAKASLLFNGLIKDGSTLQTWLSKLNSIAIVTETSGEWSTINASFVSGDVGGSKASEGLLWKTKLQTLSDYSPQIVMNESNGEKEIFTEDTANNIYLISKSGEVLFARNIGERIIGQVHQLDYYNNGKLQYIFNTANHVFMIDRSGNDAASYPLRLSSAAAGGLALVNKGSKYDYYVPCTNGAIYGYEANGRPVTGWSPKKGLGVIAKPIQIFKGKKGELMLVFNTSGKLTLIGLKGDVKWSADNLPISNQNFSVIQTENDFVLMNAIGNQLIEISSDGNDKLKPLVDSAFSFAAASTSDSSYLYFFSGQHDVRGYTGKGEFKSALSLKPSAVTGIEVLNVGDSKYLLVKDETMKKVMLYDLALQPVANYTVANLNTITITNLFGQSDLTGIQPDAQGNIQCYRIK